MAPTNTFARGRTSRRVSRSRAPRRATSGKNFVQRARRQDPLRPLSELCLDGVVETRDDPRWQLAELEHELLSKKVTLSFVSPFRLPLRFALRAVMAELHLVVPGPDLALLDQLLSGRIRRQLL